MVNYGAFSSIHHSQVIQFQNESYFGDDKFVPLSKVNFTPNALHTHNLYSNTYTNAVSIYKYLPIRVIFEQKQKHKVQYKSLFTTECHTMTSQMTTITETINNYFKDKNLLLFPLFLMPSVPISSSF